MCVEEFFENSEYVDGEDDEVSGDGWMTGGND